MWYAVAIVVVLVAGYFFYRSNKTVKADVNTAVAQADAVEDKVTQTVVADATKVVDTAQQDAAAVASNVPKL